MEEKKQPANEYSFANVTGTIWCNEREGRRPDYRVTFTVNYKTGDGTWKGVDALTTQETCNLSKVLDMCFRWIVTQESKHRFQNKRGN